MRRRRGLYSYHGLRHAPLPEPVVSGAGEKSKDAPGISRAAFKQGAHQAMR